MILDSSATSVGIAENLRQVLRSLAILGGVAVSGFAPTSTLASSSEAAAPHFVSAASVQPATSRPALGELLTQVQRANITLDGLEHDFSPATIEYEQRLLVLLLPVYDKATLSPDEVALIVAGMDTAWNKLRASMDPSDPIKQLRTHPSEPTLVDVAELAKVLASEPALGGLIAEALSHARSVFGDTAALHVEPFVDPEVTDPSVRIYLVVRTTFEYQAAISCMDQLEDWWLHHIHRASGLLSITLEFA